MTRLIFSLLLIGLLTTSPAIGHAQDTAGSTKEPTTAAKSLRHNAAEKAARKQALEEAKKAEKGVKQLEKFKLLATKMITERQEKLTALSSGNHTKKCRVAAKTEANAAISAAISRLKTDAATVPTLDSTDKVKDLLRSNVIGKNHVYVALIPAVRGMCVSDLIIAKVDSAKIKTALTKLESEGVDVSTVEDNLAKAKNSAQAAYDAYKKIANNPGSTTYKADLAAAKAQLKEAKGFLSAARDAIDELKAASSTVPAAPTEEPATSSGPLGN